jgi:geranylgeranyl diphosphate synthase, type II
MTASELDGYLADCRRLTLREIQESIPKDQRYRSILYDLMLEYPLRTAKGLRPALCIATCRALGGSVQAVLRSAATLELYHNAFLIHDDVEDGSESRRDRPTLHETHGMPIAVNVGDAMLALALQPLLDNMRLLGMGKALRILQAIARMARESAEGQAMELHWIRIGAWNLTDVDYLRMVYKKTSCDTFITPVLIGGIVAGAAADRQRVLRKFAALLGIAFQIQDDILNLEGEGDVYGKEIAGDLWEGKHTLILMHALRAATDHERQRARDILSKRRPRTSPHTDLSHVLDALEAAGELSVTARQAIEQGLHTQTARVKDASDVDFLLALIRRYHGIEHARGVARRFADKAAHILRLATWLKPSIHRDLLEGLVDFVVARER